MRIWSQLAGAFQRVFAATGEVSVGVAGNSRSVHQSFDAMSAMSTMARFPWIWVCARARLSDLSGLPLLAIRTNGAQESVVLQSPALSLLRKPAPGCSGLRYRRQVHLDWILTGNSMSEVTGSNLYRMHPGLSVPRVHDSTGRITGWTYGGRTLPAAGVLHIADVSWAQSIEMVLGETPIRALHDDLSTVLAAKEMTRIQSKRGRPDIILSPASENVNAGPTAVEAIEAAWNKFTTEGRSAFVMGRDFKHEMINFSPRDIEYASQLDQTRDITLAVFEVPPARAGLASANYGTQKQQMRTYWESLLKGQGALFEDEWSTLDPDPSVRIEHDTTNIEALQLNLTERQLRAERWMNSFGMSPENATRAEGFLGLPEGALPSVAPGNQSRPPAREPDEPQRAQLSEQLGRYLAGAAERYQERVLEADGDVSALSARSEESLRVLGVLEAAGMTSRRALEWADEIATVTDEAVSLTATDAWSRGVTRIGFAAMAAFSPERATTVAARIQAAAA